MHPTIKNILAVVLGWLGGSAINYGLIQLGHQLMPIPDIDPQDMEALAAVMPTLSGEFFIFPFLAHALGTLAGAAIAYSMATKHKIKYALAIGALFFIGGIIVSFMLPAPTWFIITDLCLAYFPMAWLGAKLASSFVKN